MSYKFFTSATRDYSSKVFTLVESFSLDQKDKFYWVIPEKIDKSIVRIPKHLTKKINIVTLKDLMPKVDKAWIYCHSIVEIATAVKATALKYFLNKSTKAVIYLDPDLYFYGELNAIKSEFKSCSIGLTPHQTFPSKGHKEFVDIDVCSYRHGIFNLGFLFISNDIIGQKFATWWEDRLLRYCRKNYFWGLFTDQKFIDIVPSIFEKTKICKNIGFNCAPWNLYYRNLSVKGGKYYVNDQPLIFYHFTGLDSGAHIVSAKYYSSKSNLTKKMISNYIKKSAFYSEYNEEYEHKRYDDGKIIEDFHRIVFRSRIDLQNKFANPFGILFSNWCSYELPKKYKKMTLDQISSSVGPHDLKYIKSDYISFLKHIYRSVRSKI